MQSAPTVPKPRSRSLSLDHVYLLVPFFLIAMRVFTNPAPPEDLWWHLAYGRVIVQEGRIPTSDEFTFTRAGVPFYNQNWLAQVLMYRTHQIGGISLLIALQAVAVVGSMVLLWHVSRLRIPDRPRLTALLLLLLALPVFNNLILRPQTLVLPIFAGYLLILTRYRDRRSAPLWLLPLLMILWANLHGSFVLGLVLIALTVIGIVANRMWATPAESFGQRLAHAPAALAEQRPLLLWGLLSGLAVLVNPGGIEVLGYVRNLTGSSQVTTMVREWAPPTIRETSEALFFLTMIGWFLLIAIRPGRLQPADYLITLPFLWLALGSVRSVIWFMFLITPLVILLVAAIIPKPRSTSMGTPVVNGMLIGIFGLLLIATTPWLRPWLQLPGLGDVLSKETPVAAVAALNNDPDRPARLFHQQGFGSYLMWAAPEQKVFVDSRIELLPTELIEDYRALSSDLNRQQLLEKYQIDGALLSNKSQPKLIAALRSDPAWQVRYEDKYAVYLRRVGP